MTNDELQSQTISFLRFPLIVGVVLIHSHITKIGSLDLTISGIFPAYTYVSYLFSEIFARIAVPVFFFISGFLFFYNTCCFTRDIYIHKLRKRASSLLIPYVFWNIFMIIILCLVHTYLPELTSGKRAPITEYSISDFLWCFWNTDMVNLPLSADSAPYPINYPLWFIRDLIVVILFSPLIYTLLRKTHLYGVVCLGVLWMFNWWFDVAGLSITAVFFFAAGAYFSIHKKNFVKLLQPLLPVAAIIYLLLAGVALVFSTVDQEIYIRRLSILFGGILVISLSAWFIGKGRWHTNAFLADSSFFIYAYHALPLAFIFKIFFRVLRTETDGVSLALYFICPMITIGVGLGVYYLMRRFLPKITRVVTGGR